MKYGFSQNIHKTLQKYIPQLNLQKEIFLKIEKLYKIFNNYVGLN